MYLKYKYKQNVSNWSILLSVEDQLQVKAHSRRAKVKTKVIFFACAPAFAWCEYTLKPEFTSKDFFISFLKYNDGFNSEWPIAIL